MAKKNVLILCLHRPNRSPSQRFRFEQFIPYLQQHGYEIDFSYLLDAKADKAFYRPGCYLRKLKILTYSTLKRLGELMSIKKYDLIFVQREAYMLGTSFFERKMGVKVPMIFDFDDSIWIENVSEGNKKMAFLKDATKTADIIKHANLVFAGNEYLANYASAYNNKVVIVPTTIDTDVYVNTRQHKKAEEPVCIGWSGSFSTIQHFSLAIPVLKKIRDRYSNKVRFKIIGDGTYYCPELETHGNPWIAETEVEDLSQIDIGIMPLADDEWAKGKCGLKGLQYMALGIPTLMSPVGVNKVIIQNGINGYLPNSDEDWFNYFVALIEDSQLRRQIGNAGKETVMKDYSTTAWNESYLKYFNEVVNNKINL